MFVSVSGVKGYGEAESFNQAQTFNTDKRILIICQGNLPLYMETLSEIDSRSITLVTEAAGTITNAVAKVVKDYFSSGEVEHQCFELLSKHDYKAIVAISETDIMRAGLLRDIFRLKGQSYHSALYYRDKILMKSLLHQNGITVPEFTTVRCALDILNFAKNHSFPLILKPSRGYGSIETFVISDAHDLEELMSKKSLFNEFHEANLDLECYTEGEMYHVDGIVRGGKVVAVWPSKCVNTCLEMTRGKPRSGYLLSPDNPLVPRLNQYACKILEILPTPTDTGFHLELFCKDGQFVFCEIASRIAANWINDLWINGLEIDLEKEFIRAQAFLPSIHPFTSVAPKRLTGGLIFPSRRGKVINIPQTCDLEGVLDYRALVLSGEDLEEPTGMLGHIASCTLTAPTEAQMETQIKLVQDWFESNLKIET
jgi:hypothetical protein